MLTALSVAWSLASVIAGRIMVQASYRASSAVGASLDDEVIASRLAQLAVPQLADWCAISLLDTGGAVRHRTVARTDSVPASTEPA